MAEKNLLIVDDEEKIRIAFKYMFNEDDIKVFEAGDGEGGLNVVKNHNIHLAILDIHLPDCRGIDLMKSIREISPKTKFIIATAYGNVDLSIEAIEHGAVDYFPKPFDSATFPDFVKNLLNESDEQVSENIKEIDKDKIVGKSIIMQNTFKKIAMVAQSQVNVLVTGESGTGKELVAKTIHKYSKRSKKPLIKINCAAIPDELLESELFGYEKGAFTGAAANKKGKFEESHEGTLFLDEIGDLSFKLQAKLLRVLQEGSFERLGSNRTINVDVRVIAATNANLNEKIEQRLFREDLYYRLNVVNIDLPPLRKRKEDIPLLVEYFCEKFAGDFNKTNLRISNDAIQMLMSHNWRGNVRELENVIKNAVVTLPGNLITQKSIYLTSPSGLSTKSDRPTLDMIFSNYYLSGSTNLYQNVIRDIERQLFTFILDKCDYNQAKASKVLNISRVTFRNKCKEFGLL